MSLGFRVWEHPYHPQNIVLCSTLIILAVINLGREKLLALWAVDRAEGLGLRVWRLSGDQGFWMWAYLKGHGT